MSISLIVIILFIVGLSAALGVEIYDHKTETYSVSLGQTLAFVEVVGVFLVVLSFALALINSIIIVTGG